MKNGEYDWGGGIDAYLRKLQRHCPKCGGDLYRSFSTLDKIGLFIPLPHTLHAKHECDQCHTRFRSFRSGTDLFLETGWLSGLFFLGEWWPFALAGTFTWLAMSLFMKDSGSRGGNDTVAAGLVTGLLWVFAIVFGDLKRGEFWVAHPIMMGCLILVLTLGPVWIVLLLDRYTTFGLRDS